MRSLKRIRRVLPSSHDGGVLAIRQPFFVIPYFWAGVSPAGRSLPALKGPYPVGRPPHPVTAQLRSTPCRTAPRPRSPTRGASRTTAPGPAYRGSPQARLPRSGPAAAGSVAQGGGRLPVPGTFAVAFHQAGQHWINADRGQCGWKRQPEARVGDVTASVGGRIAPYAVHLVIAGQMRLE